MARITTSKKYSLNWLDFAKAALMAALLPVLFLITQSLDAGELLFDYKKLAIAALSGFVGYLLKNFFQPTKIILKGDDVTKAVKEAEEQNEQNNIV